MTVCNSNTGWFNYICICIWLNCSLPPLGGGCAASHTFLLHQFKTANSGSVTETSSLICALTMCTRWSDSKHTITSPLWDTFYIFVLRARDCFFLQARAMRKSSKCELQSPAGCPQFELQWFHCANRWLHKEEVHVCTQWPSTFIWLWMTLPSAVVIQWGRDAFPTVETCRSSPSAGSWTRSSSFFPSGFQNKSTEQLWFDNVDTVAQLSSMSSGQARRTSRAGSVLWIRRLSQLSPVTSFKLFHNSLFTLNSSS